MSLNIENLSMTEIAQIEELTGLSMSQFGDADAPKAKLMTALAWLSKRREDPSFTFEQAGGLNLTEVSQLIGETTEEPDPKGKS